MKTLPLRSLGVVSLFTISLAACGNSAHRLAVGDPLALTSKTQGALGCSDFQDEFYDGVYTYLLSQKQVPTPAQMEKAFLTMLSSQRFARLSESERQHIKDLLSELYQIIAIEAVKTTADDPSDINSAMEAVAALEMGDRSTAAKNALQERIAAKFDAIEQYMKSVPAAACAQAPKARITAAEVPADSLLGQWKSTRPAAVYGGLKALATAFQSCDAGLKPALTSLTPDVRGVKVIGVHPDKIGFKREISDLGALIGSDPYLTEYQKPSMSCFDVLANPLIYDYGGKPSTTADASSALDFFTNAGTGTSVLGIDCSGYVYSSLASAGLKLKKNGRLKAAGVYGVSAKMWMKPDKNGLSCFDYVKFEKSDSIKPGDILASQGHVVMVESVGSDPFGIAKFVLPLQCAKENMSVSRFDFTILQSGSLKNGLGIDRIRAADYFAEGGAMAEALIDHAVNACLANTRGTSVVSKAAKANFVRHLGTKECMDQPVRLAHEECIMACPAQPIAPPPSAVAVKR